jgi:exosome complex component CSL4
MSSVEVTPPTLRYTDGSSIIPGDRIGTVRQVCAGPGTYIKDNGHIYASLVGILRIQRKHPQSTSSEDAQEQSSRAETNIPQFTCFVESLPGVASNNHLPATAQVLKVGQIVVGVVTRITPQMALVDIRIAQHVGTLVKTTYEGAIRMEDIRSNATEKVVLGDCFRPNDVVACRIVSLGDSRRYFLSTAETELGVLRAKTTKGVPMMPISWKEMECPETGIKELRKCAKPIALTSWMTHQRK